MKKPPFDRGTGSLPQRSADGSARREPPTQPRHHERPTGSSGLSAPPVLTEADRPLPSTHQGVPGPKSAPFERPLGVGDDPERTEIAVPVLADLSASKQPPLKDRAVLKRPGAPAPVASSAAQAPRSAGRLPNARRASTLTQPAPASVKPSTRAQARPPLDVAVATDKSPVLAESHTVAKTMAGLVVLSLLLSVLPLPDALKPFPSLVRQPKQTLLTVLWPKSTQSVPEQPPEPVLEDDDDTMVLPELDFSGDGKPVARSGLPASDEIEGRRWEKLMRKVDAVHVDIEEPCGTGAPDACPPLALKAYVDAVRALREGKAAGPVRIVTLGTSLIASDHITDVARRRLQARHGLGGLGYMYVDRPTRGAGRTVRTGTATEGWRIEKLTDDNHSRLLGLAGVGFTAPTAESQQTTIGLQGDRVAELFTYVQPGAGAIEVSVDGTPVADVSTASEVAHADVSRVPLPSGSSITLRTKNGPVRLDGVALETGKPGIVFDSLGLPGGTATVFMRANEELFAAQLKGRDPGLVILMMGGNEAFDLSLKRYSLADAKATFAKLIERVQRAVPNASCLLASPPDAGLWRMNKTIQPRQETVQVATFMRELAAQYGCAYWNMQKAMGGEGAIERWWNAGLMNRDLVHPVGIGGDVFGYMLDMALERARLRHESLKPNAKPRHAPMLRRPWVAPPAHARAAAQVFDGTPRQSRALPTRLSRAAPGDAASDGPSPSLNRGVAVDGGASPRKRPTVDAGRANVDASVGDDGDVPPLVRPAADAGRAQRRDAGERASAPPSSPDAGIVRPAFRPPDAGASVSTEAPRALPLNELAHGAKASVDAGLFAAASEVLPLTPAEPGGLPRVHVNPAPLSTATALSHPEALKRFFAKLQSLELTQTGRVSVVQIGASHTAAQYFTDAARIELAERFGYAGRGFIAAGKPSDRLHAGGVHRSLEGSWELLDAMKVKTPGLPWGLTGVRAVGKPKSTFSVSFEEPSALGDDSAHIQVYLHEQPGMGGLDVSVNGRVELHIEAPPPSVEPRARVVELGVPGGWHEVKVTNTGPGDVSLFGVSHELVRPGIVYDALGLPGSTAITFAGYDAEALRVQLKARQPDLFVMFFGTNEAALPTDSLEAVREAYPRIIATLRAAAPDSACLFMGPTDRMTKKRGAAGWHETESMDEVYELIREVAHFNGCAFWSTREVMGGEGSIEQWRQRSPPLANKDHVHLTRDGYQLLARSFIADLMLAYHASKEALSP